MGWRSYILPYGSEDEKQKIIESIKEHNIGKVYKGAEAIKFRLEAVPDDKNDYDDNFEDTEAGEELISFVDTPFKHQFLQSNLAASLGVTEKKNAILCGNGGGSPYTYMFFSRRNITILSYSEYKTKLLEDKGVRFEL
jgi:hypothetical protein